MYCDHYKGQKVSLFHTLNFCQKCRYFYSTERQDLIFDIRKNPNNQFEAKAYSNRSDHIEPITQWEQPSFYFTCLSIIRKLNEEKL